MNDINISHEIRYEALRDPSGLQDFRRLLSNLITGIDTVQKEKEQQYMQMKAVCLMMEDMDVQVKEEVKTKRASTKDAQKLIKSLMAEN